ncbi:hypothetical protein E2C01_024885 [Portunus trituberculatus]|uniref:Uncharacterized protein n=1 Tax=Portunus trituberculatus TaxID=210409 RepID=A0A5B7EBF8_PORTR|nr:hypothetical protein [Portunus trituberculatus]
MFSDHCYIKFHYHHPHHHHHNQYHHHYHDQNRRKPLHTGRTSRRANSYKAMLFVASVGQAVSTMYPQWACAVCVVGGTRTRGGCQTYRKSHLSEAEPIT